MPSVSIIVPIYNSEDTIGECIRSIVSQSFTDIEIILVNDGSTDKCKEICDEYAQNDARIRVFYQENKGRSAARLNGFIHSTGEWIAFVDSDDTIPNNAIERLYNSTCDNTDIVFGNGYSLANEKRTVIPIEDLRHLTVRAEGTIGVPWGSLYRRTLLSEYSFDIPRDIYNGEDYIFWLRTVFKTEKPVNIVYESVYNKGEEHTSNCFKWTAEYCYKLNEYRKNSIPSNQHEEYMHDMICDRMENMYAVAVSSKKNEWKNSDYYCDLIHDIKDAGISLTFKQKLFFMLPSRWMRKQLTSIGSIIRSKYFFFLFIVALAMFVLNIFDAKTLSDDLVYRFVFQENERNIPHIINNLSDLLESQINHFFYVNGRIVVHTIAQTLLSFFPSIVYKTLNTILFPLLLYLSMSLMKINKNERLFASILMSFLLLVVFSGINTSILWSMGTFNYLWVSTFTIVFILFLRYLDKKNDIIYWFIAPISFLIGCSHEALSLPLSITFIIYLIVNRREIIHKPIISCLVFYILGAIICLSSPGIIDRADGEIILQKRILSGILNLLFNVRVTWLLLISLIFIWKRNREKAYREIFQNRYYYITLIMCLGIVFLCGSTLDRVAFYSDFISMLLLVRIISNNISLKTKRYTIFSCSIVMLVFFIFAIIARKENFDNWQHITKQMDKPGQEIISVRQPEKGRSRIMDFFREHYVNPSVEFGYYCVYMAFNTNDINTRLAAAISGKKDIVFLPEDVVERIESDENAYTNYELDRNKNLYVWRIKDNHQVKRIVFNLKPEDTSKLLTYQRLMAYKGDTYVMDDDFHYSVVEVCGRSYLIFTKPTTNIYRRIKDIRYEFQ